MTCSASPVAFKGPTAAFSCFARFSVNCASGFAALCLGASLGGCAEGDPQEAPEMMMDIAEVQSNLDEMSEDFQQINTEPFPSQVAEGRFINVWANEIARSVYEEVHVDGEPTNDRLPTGAMIVRELVDAEGVRVKYTVLVQQPEGTSPETQDMWFSETGPDGKLKADDMSAMCFTCHAARPDHAFLFGVPLDFAR